MPTTIPLDTFVDFALARHSRRLSVVRDFKQPGASPVVTDFYRPVREAMVAGGLGALGLDTLLTATKDKRKRAAYPAIVAGWQRFLATAKPTRWQAPPRTFLPLVDLEVAIAPEVHAEIGGHETLIFFHFHGVAPAHWRVELMLGLAAAALGPARPGATFALLDVPRARVHTLKKTPNPRFGLICRGEAAALSTLCAAI